MADTNAIAEDRRAVLQLLYEAHNREPCGPTLEAISAAIQHLQAVDGITLCERCCGNTGEKSEENATKSTSCASCSGMETPTPD